MVGSIRGIEEEDMSDGRGCFFDSASDAVLQRIKKMGLGELSAYDKRNPEKMSGLLHGGVPGIYVACSADRQVHLRNEDDPLLEGETLDVRRTGHMLPCPRCGDFVTQRVSPSIPAYHWVCPSAHWSSVDLNIVENDDTLSDRAVRTVEIDVRPLSCLWCSFFDESKYLCCRYPPQGGRERGDARLNRVARTYVVWGVRVSTRPRLLNHGERNR